MTTLKYFFQNTLLLLCILLSVSCSAGSASPEMVLVGSTPGDEPVKSMLSIPSGTKIDFIRWNLVLDSRNFFVLDLAFGESLPNTMGFKAGGEKRTVKGQFTVSEDGEKSNFKTVYHLKSSDFTVDISLVKINENLFHLLTPQNKLLIGNGGWSYSLNREKPVSSGEILISSIISDEKSLQLIFDGRTPCQEIAAEHPEMKVNQSCFKLKWRLILNRDPVNHLPTTYTIRKVVDNQARDVSGNWTIIKGIATNPDVIIYRIEPDKPDEINFISCWR